MIAPAPPTSEIASDQPQRPRLTRPSLRAVLTDRTKRCVVTVGCGLNWLFGSRAGNNLGVLMYHRVVDHVPGVDPPTWNITPVAFHEQMSGLLERGFQPWSLRRVIESRDRGEELPPKSFIVTFDDAHESVYLHAWPVLRRLNIPATVFLATSFLDSQEAFPFDDWSAAGTNWVPIETWRPLSSAQCCEMSADGLIELGAHTHTHQDFGTRPQEFASDLAVNVAVLRARYDRDAPALAFPFGRVTPALMEAARNSSVICALTTEGVPLNLHDTPFGWGRFDVEAWDTSCTLAAKLGGWYSWAPRLQRRIGTLAGRLKNSG